MADLVDRRNGRTPHDDERATFTELTGRAHEPGQRVEELVAVVGRRGGKSRAMSTLAAYIAGLCAARSRPGETGICLVDRPGSEARRASLSNTAPPPSSNHRSSNNSSPTAPPTRLSSLTAFPSRFARASFRRLRGPTYVAVIADEAAFFMSDEYSVQRRCGNSQRGAPGLATTDGPLIIASCPTPSVAFCGTRTASITAKTAIRSFSSRKAPSATSTHHCHNQSSTAPSPEITPPLSAEYLAQFRNDIETFVPYEVVAACVGDHIERAPLTDTPTLTTPLWIHRVAAADSFTLAIGHRDGERFVIDAITRGKTAVLARTSYRRLRRPHHAVRHRPCGR